MSGRMGSSGSKRHRRASTGRLFCVGEGGDGILFWAGKGEFGLEELPRGERRDNVVRGCGEAAGYCSERENGEFGLEELPQGERRDIVLRGAGGRGRRQDIVLSGGRASSGSKNCRSASAGILFCVGKNRRGRRQDIVLSGREGSSGSKSCRRASAGRLFCAGRRGMGEVAGDWCERENGDSGLKGLPQGEHRDIVVRGGREEGARQEIDLSGGSSEFGLEELPRASAGRQFCVGGRGQDGGGGRRLFWAGAGGVGLDELPQGERRDTVLRGEDRTRRRQEIALSGGRGSSGS